MDRTSPAHDPTDFARHIAAFADGDDSSGDRLCAALEPPVTRAVDAMLGADDAFRDDIIQDTQISVLSQIRKNRGFDGDLVQYAVTVARNRCRNLYRWRQRRPGASLDEFTEWKSDPGSSPLDLLLEDEVGRLVQEALDGASLECRHLLSAFYIEGEPLETIRARVGLKSIQALFYRKKICLEAAFRLLEGRL